MLLVSIARPRDDPVPWLNAEKQGKDEAIAPWRIGLARLAEFGSNRVGTAFFATTVAPIMTACVEKEGFRAGVVGAGCAVR